MKVRKEKELKLYKKGTIISSEVQHGKIDFRGTCCSEYEIKGRGYPRSDKEIDSIKKVQPKKQKYVKKNLKIQRHCEI
jgi:hypothetical protein